MPDRRRAHQIQVFTDITRDQLAALETHEQDFCLRTTSRNHPTRLPCLSTNAEPVRTYPFGALAAHALGYLNEMNAEELERLREPAIGWAIASAGPASSEPGRASCAAGAATGGSTSTPAAGRWRRRRPATADRCGASRSRAAI